MIELSKYVTPSGSNAKPSPIEPARETLIIKDQPDRSAQQKQEIQRAAETWQALAKSGKMSKEQASEWTSVANEFMSSMNLSMHFQMNEKAEQWFVELIDDHSGDVIRQIPSKEVLHMAARIREMMDSIVAEKEAVGVLVDQKL